ncbi:MAG: DUF1343 domain-containing protein [Saprospiraceae bacterium]|nr:DUF1343 domain-containing protein [Saprospiraceae bacterium]
MYYTLLITFLIAISQSACTTTPIPSQISDSEVKEVSGEVRPGAWQLQEYLTDIEGKKIGLVVNHTSTIGNRHLVDTLLSLNMKIIRIFSPEHGFRCNADAGAHIEDEKDPETGIPIVSLYGNKQKPSQADLKAIDVMIFDIQDVGARFYTYISTLHYVMEACAEVSKTILLLDRPNPNGHYMDGPIREDTFRSFVGMHPVPVVYGMTIGEYAQMINGEGWLNEGIKCDLKVVKCGNYDHQTIYDPPLAPSPNLPNLRSILLYPSLCFFEGTPLSIGRGTTSQFQVIGHPDIKDATFTFIPKPMFGAANPKLKNETCYGEDLTGLSIESIHNQQEINLEYVIRFYNRFSDKTSFFNQNGWFDKLAGTTSLRKEIIAGKSAKEIRASWQTDLVNFAENRLKYLLYP